MKRVLEGTSAARCSKKKPKDTAPDSSRPAALKFTCWKHFKGLERGASDRYWYLATCNFCAHAERLRLKTGRDRSSSCTL